MKGKTIVFIMLFIAVAAVIWGYSAFPLEREPAPAASVTLEESDVIVHVTVSIKGVVEDALDVEIEKGDSALDLLVNLNEEIPSLNLQTKTFEGLGVLVEAMGDKVNGDGNKYWQYYVNDIQPSIGAGAYVLEEGDSVLWVFAESTF